DLEVVATFLYQCYFFFSSRRRHTRSKRDWSSDVCSSDLVQALLDLLGDGPCVAIAQTQGAHAVATPDERLLFGDDAAVPLERGRSEERRVGKECRSRGSTYH